MKRPALGIRVPVLVLLTFSCIESAFAQSERTQRIQPPDTEERRYFGSAVAMDGGNAVFGASGDDGAGVNSGAAYFYQARGLSTGSQDAGFALTQKVFASDARADQRFGEAVALDGSHAAIRSLASVYLYQQYQGEWVERQRIDIPNYDYFPSTIALEGDTLVMTSVERAVVYEYQHPQWVFVQELIAPGSVYSYGCSVDLSLNRRANSRERSWILVGDHRNYDGGAVFAFEKSGGRWNFHSELGVTPGGLHDTDFGFSVAVDGDRCVAGAPGWDYRDEGAAFVFAFDGDQWLVEHFVPGSFTNPGLSVGLQLPWMGMGIPRPDGRSGVNNSGSIEIWHFDGTDWNTHSGLRGRVRSDKHDFFGPVSARDGARRSFDREDRTAHQRWRGLLVRALNPLRSGSRAEQAGEPASDARRSKFVPDRGAETESDPRIRRVLATKAGANGGRPGH